MANHNATSTTLQSGSKQTKSNQGELLFSRMKAISVHRSHFLSHDAPMDTQRPQQCCTACSSFRWCYTIIIAGG